MESVIEFKLPALGENIEQGDLVRLMIAPGATVSEGQSVMELETDKAVVEVPSSVSGTVKEILVKEGDKIKVGQVIFTADNGVAAAVVSETPRQEEPAKRAGKAQAVQAASGASSVITAATAKPQPARTSQSEPQPAAATNSIDRRAGSQRVPAAGAWRKHFGGRSGAVDDRSGRKGFGRPAGDGTGNRQGRGRSSLVGERRCE